MSENVLIPIPTCVISRKVLHFPFSEHRSIKKPSSLFELSAQARSIWAADAAFADKLVGAAGGGVGVGDVAGDTNTNGDSVETEPHISRGFVL